MKRLSIAAILLLVLCLPIHAHAAIALRGVTSDGLAGGATGCAPPPPTGLAVGDLMVFHGMNNIALYDLRSGWTQLYNNSTSGRNEIVAYKIADSADVATSFFAFNFSSGSGSQFYCTLQAWSGTSQTAPIDQFQIGAGGTLTVPTLTGITPTKPNGTFVMIGYGSNSTAVRTASGYQVTTDNPTWTEADDEGGTTGTTRINMAVAYGSRPQTTSSGAAQLTWSGAELQNDIALYNIVPPSSARFAPWQFMEF